MASFNDFLKMNGITYNIERNGISTDSQIGLPNHEQSTRKPYVGFKIGTDIQINDWLVNTENERFLVIDKKTRFVHGEPFCIMAYIITEYEVQPNIVLNNHSIDNLSELIKNDNSEDKESLEKMFSVLNDTVSTQKSIEKGFLSEFVDVLQKNERIAVSTAVYILKNFLLSE